MRLKRSVFLRAEISKCYRNLNASSSNTLKKFDNINGGFIAYHVSLVKTLIFLVS